MNKQRLSVVTMFITFLLILSSCTNEPVDPVLAAQLALDNASSEGGGTTGGGNSVASGVFTATVSGQSFVADATAGTYVTVNSSNVLTITGIKPTGEYIGIQLVNPTVGTFVVNTLGGNQTLSYRENSATTDIYSAFNPTTSQPTGTLTVASLDLVNKKVSGTFSFTGYVMTNNTLTKQISNGVFTNISFSDSTTPPATSGISGTYLLTAFNTSIPTDLNSDGTPSTNQLSETNCYNNMLLTLNSDNTFVANSKGIDIESNGTTETMTCFTDPDDTGTWSLVGNTLTLTISGTPQTIETYTVSGNTISATATNGQVVGYDTTTNAPAYLTCDITIVYTKQ